MPGHDPLFAEGGFPSSYTKRIEAAKAVVRRIKEDDRNYNVELMDSAKEKIAELMEKRRPGWEARVAAVQKHKDYYKRTLKPEATAVLDLWKQRIAELELAASCAQMATA